MQTQSPRFQSHVFNHTRSILLLQQTLRVGTQFDMPLLVHKVGRYLNVKSTSTSSLWHWIRLADKGDLSVLPALVSRAVEVDRVGCGASDDLLGLSNAALMLLVKGLVGHMSW
jgi:hypothetical protein